MSATNAAPRRRLHERIIKCAEPGCDVWRALHTTSSVVAPGDWFLDLAGRTWCSNHIPDEEDDECRDDPRHR